MVRTPFWSLILTLICAAGCTLWQRAQVRPEPSDEEQSADRVAVVGDLAVPYGLHPVRVEGVGLVTNLKGTGCDPKPSTYRQILLSEMRVRGVEDPQAVLASPNTALVLVRGYLPPGVQKGDRFDVEVRLPSDSEATSLRGGWLLECDLKEYAVLSDNRLHTGHTLAKAAGPIMIDPLATKRGDKVLAKRGWILGGAVALKERPLGLVLKPEHQSVLNASRIETAINRRFFTFDRGTKVGVARAKTDQLVELRIHPRYKYNIERYIRVVRAIPLRNSERIIEEELARLEKQLLDPISASGAAVRLEAIGRSSIDVLRKGLQSQDPEVRFYAAEALAYLDVTDAAEPLAQLAQDEPAFRALALVALSAMDDAVAAEQLRQLLNAPSAETRYGAFRALWAMKHKDPIVLGENMNDQFSYHVLETDGPPLIHLTRSFRPEVVLFGANQHLKPPFALEAGNEILVVGDKTGQVVVSKFAVGQPDQKRFVSTKVDDIIRAIVELGGTYPDVVQALQQAEAQGALEGRLAIDAVPKAGRRYTRSEEALAEKEPTAEPKPSLQGGLSGLFAHLPGISSSRADEAGKTAWRESEEKPGLRQRMATLFDKINPLR